MRITSADRRSWLEVLRPEKGPHSPHAVTCFVDIGHGQFSGKNSDLHFLNLADFVDALDRFILDRSIVPTLNGTYGTYIKLAESRERYAVVLSFAIGNAFAGGAVLCEFKMEGTFQVEQGDLNSIVEGFRALAVAA